MKRRGDIKALDASKGGIPETRKNKNREALFVFDREKGSTVELKEWLEDAILDMEKDAIDNIVITVKKMSW